MKRFDDLSTDDQDQAVNQALAVLMVDGIPTMAEARSVAAAAWYPEEDDVILFLRPLDYELELESGDVDAELIQLLGGETEEMPNVAPIDAITRNTLVTIRKKRSAPGIHVGIYRRRSGR